MTPACSGATAAFVIYVAGADEGQQDTRPPLAISPAARRLGVAADAPLSELRRRAFGDGALRFVPAASWCTAGGGAAVTTERDAVAAYLRVLEQGPWGLVRRLVEGEREGLELLGNDDGAALGERFVRMPATEGGLDRARELGSYLQNEVQRLLGYDLPIGAAAKLEDARREARGLLLLSRAPPPAPPPATDIAAAPPAEGQQVDVAEYMCDMCKAFFFDPTALLAHVQERHRKVTASRRGAQTGRQSQASPARTARDEGGGLEGPGRAPFTQVLAALTDPAAIEAFLEDLEQGGAAAVIE